MSPPSRSYSSVARSIGVAGLAAVLVGVGCDGATPERSAEAAPFQKLEPKAEPVTQPPPAVANPAVRAPEPVVPRAYAKTRFVWVRPEPDARKQWIGFLWTGGSVRLKSTTPTAGPGCSKFYPIEPQGYVCVDGERATLDADDPVYRAIRPYAPNIESPWLHRYGESRGLVRYFGSPTPELQRRKESDLAAHLRSVEAARAGALDVPEPLVGVDLSVPETAGFEFPALPRWIYEDRKLLKRRSTVAYTAEARFGDRPFLLTADFTWVPKDRVVPFPVVSFHGVQLGREARLPLAFFRRKERPRYRRLAEGGFEPTGEPFARLSHVELTGQKERWNDARYFETREPGVWLREIDAVIPDPRTRTPWGAPIDQEDTTGRAPKGRGTWIEISIEGGWLLAFEGTRAVYATMMSPGRGGAAKPDEDPLDRSASPVGVYPISGKLLTATMVAPGDLVHSDVPFAQNIVGPYALHSAYWHDNWGNPQSGGCINLSPIDAKWLFEFTEPKLPDGWHAVRWLPWQSPATIVILHR